MLEKKFLRVKPSLTLILLKKGPSYASKIAREVDATYAYMVKLLNEFEKLGLVVFEKQGRIKRVKLTEVGMDIAHDLEGLYMKLQRVGKESSRKPSK